MAPIGFGLERLGLLALRRRRVALALLALLAIAAGAGWLRLGFDDDLRNVFRSDGDSWQRYERLLAEFPEGQRDIIVLAEADDFRDPAKAEALRQFHLEAALVEGVGGVISVFTLRRYGASISDTRSLFPLQLDRANLEAAFAEADRHPLARPRLISFDRRSALMLIETRLAGSQPQALSDILLELERNVAVIGNPVGVRFAFTGPPILRQETVRLLTHDQIVFNLSGVALGFLCSLIFFRSFAAAALAALPAIAAGYLVLGAFGILGVKINVITNVVPLLVLVLGYSDSMHLSRAFYRCASGGMGWKAAAAEAVSGVGPACALSAVTTAIAFLSLTLSESHLFSGFGVAGALATITTFATVIVVHPLLCGLLGPMWLRSSGDRYDLLSGPFKQWSVALVEAATARPRLFVVVGAVMMLAFAAAYSALPTSYSLRENISAEHPAEAALLRTQREFGGTLPLNVMVPLETGGGITDAGLDRVRTVHEAVESVVGADRVISLWSIARWIDPGERASAESIRKALAAIPNAARQKLLGQSGDIALITAYISDEGNRSDELLIDKVESVVMSLPIASGQLSVTGSADLTARESHRLIRWLNASLLAAIVVSLGAIALALRSVAFALICFMPNVLPLFATAAYLFVSGQGLRFSSMLAFTVAFGIAVDDTIHFLNRFREEERHGGGTRRAVMRAAESVGPVMIATTFLLAIGIGTTAFSGLPTVRQFGFLAIVFLLAALVADLVILPALLLTFRRNRSARKRKP